MKLRIGVGEGAGQIPALAVVSGELVVVVYMMA